MAVFTVRVSTLRSIDTLRFGNSAPPAGAPQGPLLPFRTRILGVPASPRTTRLL